MARVAPSADGSVAVPVLYDLAPLRELPTLDLSISVRTRFFSASTCAFISRFVRKWGLVLDVAYAVGLICVPVIMLAPVRIGNIASITATICSLPGSLLGPTLLRFEIIQLLLHTYDFWFFVTLVFTTFCVLGGILGPWRSISLSVSTLGALTNVVVDANVRVPKAWVFYSFVAISMHLVTVAALSFELIDGMNCFAVLHVRDHVLPATAFASNGLLTVCALLGRSVYRRREAVAFHRQTAHSNRVRCVGYRTPLCFRLTTQAVLTVLPSPNATIIVSSASGGTTQQLRHEPLIDRIDASQTAFPIVYHLLLKLSPRHRRLVRLIHLMGLASITMAFLVEFVAFVSGLESDDLVLSLALTATVAYCCSLALCYHRVLLLSLIKSFDFVFLATQVTVAHICVCDFFRWTPHSMKLVAISWIWIHSVICLDALTPVVRSRLHFHVRTAALALTLCFVSSTTLVLSIIFCSVRIFDRTLWSGGMFGHRIHVRVVPLFYNCFFTAFALMVRILGRLCTISNETLLVLDGAVVYENNILQQKKVGRRPALRQEA